MTRRELAALKDIRAYCTMENFSCKNLRTGDDKSDEVRELTRLFRQTWILEPLDAIIAKNDPENAVTKHGWFDQ